MNRRTFLASVGVASPGLSGCLSDDSDTLQEGDNLDTLEETEYEKCPQTIIHMENLPAEVDEEVTKALENGLYETDSDLYVMDVMDPDSSYLRAGREGPYGPRIYYQPVIESGNGTTKLMMEESIPTRSGSISLRNGSETDISVSVRLVFEPYSETFDDEVLVDEDFEIDVGDSVTLVSGDTRYGSYSTEIDFHSEKEVAEASSGINMGQSPPSFRITDKREVSVEQAVADMLLCEWDASGDVTY